MSVADALEAKLLRLQEQAVSSRRRVMCEQNDQKVKGRILGWQGSLPGLWFYFHAVGFWSGTEWVKVPSACTTHFWLLGNANTSIMVITVGDSSFSFSDSAPVPECCGDNEILGEVHTHVGINVKAAQCSCVLDCCVEDTKCVKKERHGELREQQIVCMLWIAFSITFLDTI
jgi:hypothetical protein